MSTELKRPNVLFFVVDEMRADHLGCAGNALVRTPNLDRLAAEGVHFPRAYCNNPICMPARTTMFTGCLPRDHGVWHNNMEMRGPLPLLPQMLADAGYATHAAGKLHVSRWIPEPDSDPKADRFPEASDAWHSGRIAHFPTPYFGFQSVDFVGGHGSWVYGDYFRWLENEILDARKRLGPQGALAPPTGTPNCWKMSVPEALHYNHWIADGAMQFIEGAAGRGQPWFLWCSFPDPHVPFCPPAPYCDMYDPAAMPLPNRREGEIEELSPYYARIMDKSVAPNGTVGGIIPDAHWQEMLALTYGMITHVDTEVGRVLAALDRLGVRDDTLIFFVSDHGDMMGDHWMIYKGPFMFEGCVRIPLIASLPGGVRGVTARTLTSQIDLVPTVLDVCGVSSPIEDRLAKTDHPYRLQQAEPIDVWPGASLRPVLEGRTDTVHDAVVIQNDTPYMGLRIRTLVTARWKLTVYIGRTYGELFDLENDPCELHNLWNRPEWRATRGELCLRLLHEDSGLAPWYPMPWWNA